MDTIRSHGATIEWLDLNDVAHITTAGASASRATSHDDSWVADGPGEQTIRVQFHHPMHVRRIRLVFSDAQQSRTQEFTVWASLHRGDQHREVVRQQFTFSPQGATREVEEYATDLEDVSALEVRIVPSIDGSPAFARLTDLRIAVDPV